MVRTHPSVKTCPARIEGRAINKEQLINLDKISITNSDVYSFANSPPKQSANGEMISMATIYPWYFACQQAAAGGAILRIAVWLPQIQNTFRINDESARIWVARIADSKVFPAQCPNRA